MRNHGSDQSRQDRNDSLGNLPQYEFRADRFSYIALGTLPFVFSVIFTYFWAFGDYDSDHQVWPIALLAYVIFAGTLLYLRSFRIAIREGVLSYRFLLHRTCSIKLSDIKQATVDVRLLPSHTRRPPYALSVEPLPGVQTTPFVINMKLLSKEHLRTLFEILKDKVVDESNRMDGVLGEKRTRRP
jgi:hypothetical protein